MHEQRINVRWFVGWLVASLVGLAAGWLVLQSIFIQEPVEVERRRVPRSPLAKQIELKPNAEPLGQAETLGSTAAPVEQATKLPQEFELGEDTVSVARQEAAEVQKREQAVGARELQLLHAKPQDVGGPQREDIKPLAGDDSAEEMIEERPAQLERETAWLERETLVHRWTIDGSEVIAEFVDFHKNKVIVRDFHNRQSAISPQRLTASDRAWYRSVLRPVEDPIRKEQLRQYRAARARAKSAARRASHRNAMRALDAALRNQRRQFQRRTGHP